jgi:hypothetical protein
MQQGPLDLENVRLVNEALDKMMRQETKVRWDRIRS